MSLQGNIHTFSPQSADINHCSRLLIFPYHRFEVFCSTVTVVILCLHVFCTHRGASIGRDVICVAERWDLVDLPFFGLSQFEIPRRHIVYILDIAVVYGIIVVVVIRPNQDDYYYFANAFYAYANPDQPMSHVVHSIVPLTTPFSSARWATSGPYEYFAAALALMSHCAFSHRYISVCRF